jgi:TatD DNase family protein
VDWFDSHCHLQDEFDDRDGTPSGDAPGRLPSTGDGPSARIVDALGRAEEAGVTRMVCVGTEARTSAAAVGLARSVAGGAVGVWATVGLHPHDASEGVDTLDRLLTSELAAPDRVVVGIGECGLDYYYEHSPRPAQREAFVAQIELATRHRLALVVHTRDAWDETFELLTATGVPDRTIIHCFSGGPEEARRCLDLGAVLSFSGVVTFKNAAAVREAAALCPLDRLLVETDSPFLAPVPHRGRPNEPALVPLVGAVVAEVKGVPVEAVAEASTRNALAAFGLDGPA